MGHVYTATFDARLVANAAPTGGRPCRFFAVPGDPSKPFEHPGMEEDAKMWNGVQWKLGGGGTVCSAVIYATCLHTVYVGTGNGTPWSRRIRSPEVGDNLFLSSIVALHPDTGRMKWYDQTTPADNWVFTATQDMVLTYRAIDREERRVIKQAPKNGFFCEPDRRNGGLLGAHTYGAMTWATHVDLETGRPVGNPNVVWEEKPQWVLPGDTGAHNWEPKLP